jgi:hypothetical protein
MCKIIPKEEASEGIYEGIIGEDGQWLGTGKFTHNNGDVYEGEFEYGGSFALNTFFLNHFDGCRLKNGKITYSDGKIYEGTFQSLGDSDLRFLYGQGKIMFADGEIWDGEWKANKLMNGTVRFANASIHVVKSNDCFDDKFNGQGSLTDEFGDIYEGEFRGGALHRGTITYLDGVVQAVESDEFRIMKLSGNVKIANNYNGSSHRKPHSEELSGMFYDGEFCNGDFVRGRMFDYTEKRWKGTFRDGLLNDSLGEYGFAKVEFHLGNFVDGIHNGYGLYTAVFNYPLAFIGLFENGYFVKGSLNEDNEYEPSHGFPADGINREDIAKIIENSHNPWLEFEGEFSLTTNFYDNFDFFGHGKLTDLLDGTVLETLSSGKFYESELHGYGRQIDSDGTIYEGEFQESCFHGQGKLTKPDGTILEGTFHMGKFIDAK